MDKNVQYKTTSVDTGRILYNHDESELMLKEQKTQNSRFLMFLYKIKQSLKLRTIKNKLLIAKYRLRSKFRKLFRNVKEIFNLRRVDLVENKNK